MPRQKPLFPIGRKRGVRLKPSRPTSIEAYLSILPRAGEYHVRIVQLLVGRGGKGATDEEMQTVLGIGANTQRPRRVELVQAGLVVDSGTTRPTKSGRKATVWVIRGNNGC